MTRYNPEIQRVPGMLSMCGPKYAGVDDHCKYNPQTERVETVALMSGPVFKGVESANKYGILPPKVFDIYIYIYIIYI